MKNLQLLGSHRLILAAFSVGVLNFAFGICLGWTSPMIPKLRHQTYDSPLKRGVTVIEEGWIGSLIAIGGLCTAPFGGKLDAKIGKKWTLLVSGILLTISFILLLLVSEVWMLYVARIIEGFAGGFFISTTFLYIGEITTDGTRGAIACSMTVFLTGGTLYSYCLGPYMSYKVFQLCCMAVPMIFLSTFIFMPETPYYLAIKGRTKDLYKSLEFLRGRKGISINDEIKEIQAAADAETSQNTSAIDILRDRVYVKALIICCGLLFFQELSGNYAIVYNSQTIFDAAKSNIDPALASILMATIQLISSLFCSFVVEWAGRKKVLMISALGICSSMLALSAFFSIQSFGDASGLTWLPVPALIVFNISYSFGFGTVPWVIVSEILPSNIKTLASSLTTSTIWISDFLVTRWFPELNALGAYFAFFVFGIMAIISMFFIRFYVIETKGLSVQQMQTKLRS